MRKSITLKNEQCLLNWKMAGTDQAGEEDRYSEAEAEKNKRV